MTEIPISDSHRQILRLIQQVRSIPGWRDNPRLWEINGQLVDAKKAAERRRAALAFRSRCHPALEPGCVAMYSTISGGPPKKRASLIL